MANEHAAQIDFSFLNEELVQAHFADLNIELLRGTHIQSDQYYLFRLLTTKENEIRFYYRTLYSLDLIKDKYDREIYFYLDFLDEGKGKVSPQQRHRELSHQNIITGFILLKLYYDKYFESHKEIQWQDIHKEMMESEFSLGFKRIFFSEIREFYSDPEWEPVIRKFKKCLREFEILGWVKKIDSSDEDIIHFQIKESIHRFAKLYEKELTHFDEFVANYQKNS